MMRELRSPAPQGVALDQAPPTPGWRVGALLAAPHRLAFGAAVAMLAASSAWWAGVLLWRGQGAGLRWAVPPGVVHGLWLAHGFFPLFFAGFLFTAGPKWLARPAVDARRLAGPLLCSVAAWPVAALGAAFSGRAAAAGVAVAAGAFGVISWRFVGLLRASTVEDRRHAQLLALGCGAGVAMLGFAALGLALDEPAVVRAAVRGSLWACIALVHVTAVHRMVPFFTAAAVPALDARWPAWLLWTLACAVAGEAVSAMADALWSPLPAVVRWLQVALEAPVAGLLAGLAGRWGRVQRLRPRLLAMLHLGLVWLALAFALGAVSHTLMALTGDALSLGLAPLHALAMGFCASTMLAMVTRVSCGHEGRAVVADGFVWRLFWLLQAAALARVGAASWPAAAAPLLAIAGLAWAGATIAWALRQGRWYGLPMPHRATVDPAQCTARPHR